MTHPLEETLELCALGRLSEVGAAAIEEHLLVCGDCRDKFSEINEFASAMRDALNAECCRAMGVGA